ncbi:MAG TPA: MATE family efflux transporter [Firmicutes bacterium]|nr:MATE family efflux transporter [Bacillota bacterium]
MRRATEIDMCNGPLLGSILRFAIPLMLSGILQLLFNAADIIVVGQFTGSGAMAAVGSTSSLNNLIINLFLGLSAGGSVVMALFYGAKDWKSVEEVAHTAILLGFLSGVTLLFVGFILAEPLLRLMGTLDDVIDQAVLYMRIVFVGMPAMMVYDFGAGILRAVGDTRRPLIFLFCGGVINVFLNLFFVIVLEMGVAGVATATAISQCISAALIVRCLIKTDAAYRINLRRLRLVKDKLLRILRVGLPAGIQGAVFSVSNVLIQSSVNSFDSTAVVAGNTSSSNIENFVYTAMNSFYHASLNFTSQNVGANKVGRIVPILRCSLMCVVAVGLILGLSAVFFGSTLLSIYNPDPEVISHGLRRLNLICSTYFLCGMMDVTCGSIRGLGPSITPTIVSLTGACGLRIVWIYTIFAMNRSLFTLYLSYPVSWFVTFSAHLVCFCVFYRRWKREALPTARV